MNYTYRQDDIGRCEKNSNILFYYRSSHWATTDYIYKTGIYTFKPPTFNSLYLHIPAILLTTTAL